MFIAIAIALLISAKSEMLRISLFAEEVKSPCTFYKHYVPTARFCRYTLERMTFESKLAKPEFGLLDHQNRSVY